MKISIVGIGNMGSAILKAVSTIFEPKDIYISEFFEAKLLEKKNEFNLPDGNCSKDPNDILNHSDIVILAIKPQSFRNFCDTLRVDLTKKLLISIMAGLSIENLSKCTKASKIIRCMPNLCINVSKGVIGWMPNNKVTSEDKEFVVKIFESMAEQIELTDESMIDAITALSGSGPAYFFYLCEIMQQKAKELGFSDIDAKKIAEGTFVGSALTLKNGKMSSSEWKNAVTSNGGTTEAALGFMSDSKFDEIFKNAIEKANARSKELNKNANFN